MIKDPVCGKRINRNKAHIVIEYEKEKYYLCCPMCQSEFEKDPQTYLVGRKKKRKKKG
ncbi:MAG: YHS domain-containing protein [Candidatus Aenigmarchaeota archaeon]|nr:YHS domain-containing protein [Candidatus Aenigmarchaeota archaeon]